MLEINILALLADYLSLNYLKLINNKIGIARVTMFTFVTSF